MFYKALRNAPLQVLLQVSNINAGPAVGRCRGDQEISGIEDRYISAFATLTGHGSRQTRKLVAEIVHGSRGNNPSFLCPYPSGFMGVRIISSWLSCFQILETIFLSEKQMG